MSHSSTVLAQLLKLVPRHAFQTLAKHPHVGRKLRKTSRRDQFTALFMAQLSGRQSLRDIDANLQQQRPLSCGRPAYRPHLAGPLERTPTPHAL